MTILAIRSATLFAGRALFQLALLLGAAWGGQVAVKIQNCQHFGLDTFIVVCRCQFTCCGWMVLPLGGLSVKSLQYAVTADAAMVTVMNFISRSKKEQLLWKPVAALLLALNWLS